MDDSRRCGMAHGRLSFLKIGDSGCLACGLWRACVVYWVCALESVKFVGV